MSLLDFARKKSEKRPAGSTPSTKLSEKELIDLSENCFFTLGERKARCDTWRDFYYQGGTDGIADINRVYGEINNMLSLVFSPEHIILEGIRLDQSVTEQDPEQVILDELTDVVDRNFYGNRLDVKLSVILLAALIDANAIVRTHWSTTTDSVKYIHYPPDRVGVVYEALDFQDEGQIFCIKTDLTEEQVKRYYPTWWPILKEKGGGEEGKVEETRALQVLLGGQGSTQAEISVEKIFDFKGRSALNVYEQRELFQFDLQDEQWRRTVILNNHLIKDELTGLKWHNFFNIRPLIVPGTIWGLSAVYLLHKIQQNRNKLTDDLNRVEDLQSDPPLLASGYNIGTESFDQIGDKLQIPGSKTIVDGQNVKIEPWTPKLSIEDIFRLSDHYDFNQKFTLGINEVMMGQAQKNVRSEGYASMLAQFASSELKRVAHNVEAQLEDIFTTTAHLYQINDDTQYKHEGRTFSLAQYPHPYRIEIYAHSSSPITIEQNVKMTLEFAKRDWLPPEVLVKLLPMPDKKKILNHIKQVMAARAKQAEEERKEKQLKEGKAHGLQV